MKLSYNGIDLATLGELRILAHGIQREPAEAPQRERVTFRVRLDFFEASFAANFTQIETLRSALKTSTAVLLWSDDAGKVYLNRPVTAAEDGSADGLEQGGTNWQAVTFSFWYYNHEVASDTLAATFRRTGGPVLPALGAVEQWRETLTAVRFDDFRDARKRVAGTVTASGRYQADTTAPVATRRAALLALKDQLLAELALAAKGTLVYGTFTQVIRVESFTADVNQPKDYIAWSLSATFTRYPDELNFAVLDYELTPHVDVATGITTLALAGRIVAPTEAAARARLAVLQASVIPAGQYQATDVRTTAKTVGSESGAGGDGLTFIELTFALEYRDPSTRAATYQVAGGQSFTLGVIDKFQERSTVTRFSDLRATRRHVSGNLTVAGRWYVADTLTPTQQAAALAAQKALMDAQLLGGADGWLTYEPIFEQTVRLVDFAANIDRLTNCLTWTMSATYTRYPDETDYAVLEISVQWREQLAEGIAHLIVTGKIEAPTEAKATARRDALLASVVPSGYALRNQDAKATTVGSESGHAGDGLVFTELNFTAEYRDTATITCTYQRTVANAPLADLGTVDKFANRFSVTLFDDLRANRKRAAGTASLAGSWFAPETLTDAAKQTALLVKLAAFQTQMLKASTGRLMYGVVLSQIVRLVDWDAHINRLRNCIEWSLTATYTAYPNESDYALCEFNVETRQNLTDGTVHKTLTGKIGAPTPEAAQSKLARLRAALIPAGYALLSDGTTERRVDVESGRAGGQDVGDGASFIELMVSDDWQLTTGSVLSWTLRTVTEDDVKSGWVHLTYSGTVSAVAGSQATAFTAAAAMALSLGGGKQPFLIRSSVTVQDRLFQTTGGSVFVTVEFSYEYQSRGTHFYTEVSSELNNDSFGQTTETVSGYIAAPTLAQAQALYLTDVRNVAGLTGALILSERTPTRSQQRLGDATGLLVAMDDRFTFSLQVFRGKTSGSISYTTEAESNFQSSDTTTTIRGTVWAADQVAAEAYLVAVLTGLAPAGGKRGRSSRSARNRAGAVVGGTDSGPVFEAMEFAESYTSALTGVAGILESEVAMDVTYSGVRQIEKMIPDGVSIIQQAGITSGRRVVTARCLSTTSTAGDAWVRTVRRALLASANGQAGAYETPAQIRTNYSALPQTALNVATFSNVKLYELNATFSEIIPQLTFVP